MSRAAQATVSTATPNEIWLSTTELPDGKELSTYRTQPLGENSFPIKEGLATFITQFLLDFARHDIITRADRDGVDAEIRNKVDEKIRIIPEDFSRGKISIIDWIRVLNFAAGFGPANSLGPLTQIAAIAASQSKTESRLLKVAPSFFPISVHPNQLIEAVLHGDEKMVRDIINAAPELLLKKGMAIDLQGRSFTGTPLQAAIAVDDIAPNTNSTGTVEIILEHLKRLDPDNYQNAFEQQAGELYKRSLRVYVSMQEKEIARLRKFGGELPDNDPQQTGINEKMRQAQANLRAYAEALRSDDLNALFETHKNAQAANAFDFKPYVDAILAIDINDPQQKAQLDDVAVIFYTDELAFSEFDSAEIQELQQAANQMPTKTDNERAFVAKIQSISQQNNNGGQLGKFSIDETRWLMQFADKTNRKDLSAKLKAKIKVKTDAVIARTGVASKQTDECRILPFDQLTLVQKLNRLREKIAEHSRSEIISNPNHILAGLKINETVWDTLPHAQDPNYHKRAVIFSQGVGAAQDRAPEPVKQDLRQGTYYLTEKNEFRTRQARFNDWDVNYNIVRNSLVDVSLCNSSSAVGVGYKFAVGGLSGAPWWYSGGGLGFSKFMSNKNSKLSELITPRAQSTHSCVIQ